MRESRNGAPGRPVGRALVLAAVVAVLAASRAPARAEPRGAYEEMFAPLSEMLKPCVEQAERCRKAGNPEAACQEQNRTCEERLERKMEEDTVRDLEREDPRAREKIRAIDTHNECVSGIIDCFARTKALDRCVESTARCEGEGGGGDRKEPPKGCCPGACLDSFAREVKNGAAPDEAFGKVFIREIACFPDLPRPESAPLPPQPRPVRPPPGYEPFSPP